MVLFLVFLFCFSFSVFSWVGTWVVCVEPCIRYGFLLSENVASQDPLSVSVAILHQFNILPEMYQVGYTKLFFRTGQVNWILREDKICYMLSVFLWIFCWRVNIFNYHFHRGLGQNFK